MSIQILMTIIAQTGAAPAPQPLTAGGWTSMILSTGFVALLFVWCLRRVLRGDADTRREKR